MKVQVKYIRDIVNQKVLYYSTIRTMFDVKKEHTKMWNVRTGTWHHLAPQQRCPYGTELNQWDNKHSIDSFNFNLTTQSVCDHQNLTMPYMYNILLNNRQRWNCMACTHNASTFIKTNFLSTLFFSLIFFFFRSGIRVSLSWSNEETSYSLLVI